MIDTLIELIESESRQGSQSQDSEGGEFERYVNIVDECVPFQKALELNRVWSNLSYADKEMLLINCINYGRLKRIYDGVSYTYVDQDKPIPNGTIDLIEWFVSILNLGLTEDRRMGLSFPKIGSFFEDETMVKATENLSYKIKEVILPSVLEGVGGNKVVCKAIVVT